jgi:SM-20-related protein
MDVLIIPDCLGKGACDTVVNAIRRAPVEASPVYGVAAEGSHVPQIRKVKKAKVPEGLVLPIKVLIRNRLKAIGSHFGYELKTIEPPQFLRYVTGDFFVAHQDGNTPLIRDDTLERRVSISIFLNGNNEYEGGRLLLHGAYPEWEHRDDLTSAAGTLVAFRSETTHEVTPVTSGERFAIVTWLR